MRFEEILKRALKHDSFTTIPTSSVWASILGTLFWSISKPSSAAKPGYLDSRNCKVSADVLKLFMSINLTLKPYSLRIWMTCLAVISKKVSSPLTFSKLLALSRPIPVPRPPLSFKTTVFAKRVLSGSRFKSVNLSKDGTGVIVDSGMIPVAPEANELKLDSKAEIAEGETPSASIFFCWIQIGHNYRMRSCTDDKRR